MYSHCLVLAKLAEPDNEKKQLRAIFIFGRVVGCDLCHGQVRPNASNGHIAGSNK